MEDGESILDVIQEENLLEEDVDMLDVEEGELVEVQNSHVESGEIVSSNRNEVNTCTISKNRKRRNNKKKKNKKKKRIPGSGITDVNRLVIDVCRRLKEKKSYLVYSAVGCLGISAFCDLVKEVETIQACGGQKTADGKRFRTGGGILWNVVKTREPNAYREIMKKGIEFERQFRQSSKLNPVVRNDDASEMAASSAAGNDVEQNPRPKQNQHEEPKSEEKRVSVHERMRVPVRYDDLFGDDEQGPTSI